MINIGETYTSNKSGDFIILSFVKIGKSKHKVYLIRFLDTGYETEAIDVSIALGSVRCKIKFPGIAVGTLHNSNNHGSYTIISRETQHYHKGPNATYNIRFIATGYECIVGHTSIRSGEIKDPYYPRVHGVGYAGENPRPVALNSAVLKKLYLKWYSMLSRCYDTNNDQYSAYGVKALLCMRLGTTIVHF